MSNSKVKAKNAREAIEAMDLLLRLLQLGKASFYLPTGEFRFQGLMYSARGGDWSLLANVIGRGKLEAALKPAPLVSPERPEENR